MTIPATLHPTLHRTSRRTTTETSPARMAPTRPRRGIAMLTTAKRLSETQILLRAHERVCARIGLHFRDAVAAGDVAVGGFLGGAGVGELLREGGPLAQGGAFPVDDVDGDDEEEGDAEEDCGGVGEVVFAADVCEEGGGREGQNTSQKISGPAVTAGSRGRVRTISTDHVIDRSHVDTVVRDSDNG